MKSPIMAGMKLIHFIIHNGCNHISMVGLKLIYPSKGGHRDGSFVSPNGMLFIIIGLTYSEPLYNMIYNTLQWRHNEHDDVSNHQTHGLLNGLFMRRSKKTPKLRVTGLIEGNSPVTGEFPAKSASNAENVSIIWRHHVAWQWQV